MKTLKTNESLLLNCKKRICLILALMLFSANVPIVVSADEGLITIDPALSGAIGMQTGFLKESFDKRAKTRAAVAALQLEISECLEKIHSVENKTLNYMKQASSVMDNLMQIKNVVEYGPKIVMDVKEVYNAAAQSPMNAVLVPFCTKRFMTTAADVASLVSLMDQLVTSTEYKVGKSESNSKKKKVNLLNSAERYEVLNSVENKLHEIHMDIRMIKYAIQFLSWRDVWRGIDRDSYIKSLALDYQMKGIIKDMKNIGKRI